MAKPLGVALLLGMAAGAVVTAVFDGMSMGFLAGYFSFQEAADIGLLAGSVVFLVALLQGGRPMWRWPFVVIVPGFALSAAQIAGRVFVPTPSENYIATGLHNLAVFVGTFIVVLLVGVVAVVLATRRMVEPRAAMTGPVLVLFCGLVILAYAAGGFELIGFSGIGYDWRVAGLIIGLLVGIGQALAVARYPLPQARG